MSTRRSAIAIASAAAVIVLVGGACGGSTAEGDATAGRDTWDASIPSDTQGDTAPADLGGLDVPPGDVPSEDAGRDQGQVDLCADVTCDPDEVCDPDTGACLRVGSPPGSPAGSCDATQPCDEGECVEDGEDGLPGGFCRVACSDGAICGEDAYCVTLGTDEDGNEEGICFDACGDGSVCREGWLCSPGEGGEPSLCVPDCRLATCGAESFCHPVTGFCEPSRPGGQLEDEPCSVLDDTCAESLVCLPEDETGLGVCRRACLANAADTGCGARELCVAIYDEPPVGLPDVGVCIRGDDCDPRDPAAACGPDMACLAVPPATFCVPTGDAPLGAACGEERWCEPGLVCHLGHCVAVCGAESDCAGDTSCIDYADQLDGVPFPLCFAPCDVYGQEGCAEGEICVLAYMAAEGAVRGACLAAEKGGGEPGDVCTPDAEIYWGSCGPSNLCTDLFGPATCHGLCDVEQPNACPADTVCAIGLFDPPFERLGLCMDDCQVLGAESGCPEGEVCGLWDLEGITAAGAAQLVGDCQPSDASLSFFAPCVLDPDGYHDCPNGYLCSSLEPDGQPYCLLLCEDVPDSTYNCPVLGAPFECVTGLFAGESTRYGVCLPTQ